MKKAPSAQQIAAASAAATPPPAYAARYASFANENPAAPSTRPVGVVGNVASSIAKANSRLTAGRPSLLGGVN